MARDKSDSHPRIYHIRATLNHASNCNICINVTSGFSIFLYNLEFLVFRFFNYNYLPLKNFYQIFLLYIKTSNYFYNTQISMSFIFIYQSETIRKVSNGITASINDGDPTNTSPIKNNPRLEDNLEKKKLKFVFTCDKNCDNHIIIKNL